MRSAVTSPSWAVEATHRDVRALEEMLLDLPAWPGDEPKRHGADAVAPPAEGAVDVHVEVQLLGGFTVLVQGIPTPAGAWSRRHAAALVKLLALSPGGRLHRDRVVDTLWPDLTVDLALPRLHKAAHYARRELGNRDGIVLRGEVVALFPGATLEVDAVTFEAAADAALGTRPVSPDECARALKLAGDLLPDDLGEPWLDEPRERLRLRVVQLLRGTRRWEDLLRVDPMDEQAHVELLREAVAAGDRTSALRRYARMERVLQEELGISPSAEAIALRQRVLTADDESPLAWQVDAMTATPRTADRTDPVTDDAELHKLTTAVSSAVRAGRGVVVVISGEADAGRSTLARALFDHVNSKSAAGFGACTLECWDAQPPGFTARTETLLTPYFALASRA
jgi:DNA-binding SARP family transcriptional activator